MPDSQIDFSDTPESTVDELRRARRVGRPASGMAKQLIAIRLSPQLLDRLRKMAVKQHKPYQTLIHELLEKAVSVGGKVNAGQTLLIIEAMKTFNPIKAPKAGTVMQILIENARPVEFGQPLFKIRPA